MSHIHELIYSGNGWEDRDLTVKTGAPEAIGNTGIAGYTTPGYQHIIYLDGNFHVREMYNSDFLLVENWIDHDLTHEGNGVPASEGPSPIAAFATPDTFQHVNYIGSDGSVHQLFFDNTNWTDSYVAPNNSSVTNWAGLAGYITPDGAHVNYIDNGANVEDLQHNNGDPQDWWAASNLSWGAANNGGKIHVATGSMALDGYVTQDGAQHVNYVDTNFHVRELYPDGNSWIDEDLTLAAPNNGGSTLSAIWGLDGYITSDGAQHVNYLEAGGNGGHVHELYLSGANAQWLDNNLNEQADYTSSVAGGGLVGYTTLDGIQHVIYSDYNTSHICELYYQGRWWGHSLSAAAGVQTAPPGYFIAGYITPDDTQHIIYAM